LVHTPQEDRAWLQLSDAFYCIRKVVEAVNEKKRNFESLTIIKNIQETVSGVPDV
jgi:hypothetical protein